MDWTIISTILTGIFGSATVVGAVVFPRLAKRAKEADTRIKECDARIKEIEAKDKESEHTDRRLDALHEDIDTLNKQLTEAYKDKARQEGIIADKTALIRRQNEELLAKEREVGRLNMIIQWLKLWHCRRPQGDPAKDCRLCDRRLPSQPFNIPYEPPRELADELTADSHEETFNITINENK